MMRERMRVRRRLQLKGALISAIPIDAVDPNICLDRSLPATPANYFRTDRARPSYAAPLDRRGRVG